MRLKRRRWWPLLSVSRKKKRGSKETHLVSFITVLQIECARVEIDQSYMAAHQAGAVGRRTSVSSQLGDRRNAMHYYGPKTLWASILEPSEARVKSIGSKGGMDLGQLRRSYVRLFTATATLHLRCNADSIVLCPCTRPLLQDSLRQLQLFLIRPDLI